MDTQAVPIKIQLAGEPAAYVSSAECGARCTCGKTNCPHMEAAIACGLIPRPANYSKRWRGDGAPELALIQVVQATDLLYHNADYNAAAALLAVPGIEVYIPLNPPGEEQQPNYVYFRAGGRGRLPLAAYSQSRQLGGEDHCVELRESGDGTSLGIHLIPAMV